LPTGGFTFAEFPDRAAPEARIIWRAERDPETLAVVAVPTHDMDPDKVDPAALVPWLTIVRDGPVEHAVLTDGWHRIRLDVMHGSLAAGQPVHLYYQIDGTINARAKLLPLRRLLHLHQHRVFAPKLYPRVQSIGHALTVLRVNDATQAGASHRDIARALFGSETVAIDWNSSSDFLRSRVRRLVANARRMRNGGFKTLLTEDRPSER
jgi:hypothetical protein